MLKIFLKYKVKNGEMIHFLKKLALLMGAGVPVAGALDSAAKNDYFKGIADKVKSGKSFSGALETNVFPPAVIGIISVSEKNGALAAGLARACQYLDRKEAFRKKIIGALIYPAFVMVLCCASIFILVSFLLPSFAGIFRSIGVSLPPLSAFILDSSRFFPLLAVIFIILLYYAFKYLVSDKGFKFPLLGNFRAKLVSAVFFRSMAESLSSGMNIIDSLALSSSVISSRLYKEKLACAIRLISEGNSLSDSLHSTGLFDEMVISLISAGELSSSLDRVFSQLSELYEGEIEGSLRTFVNLVEPASTLATGLVVGIIVFAMFMPIIKLISVLGS